MSDPITNNPHKRSSLCNAQRDAGINHFNHVTELSQLLYIEGAQNTEAGVLKSHQLPEGCRRTDINQETKKTTA